MTVKCCQQCSYTTNSKWAYDNHMRSKRHIDMGNPESTFFTCKKCAKKYQSRMGAWQHEKTCTFVLQVSSAPLDATTVTNEQIMLQLIKNNEQNGANITNNIITTNNIQNNYNQQVHVYLNTQCKDAMNIQQFIDAMKLLPNDIKIFQNEDYGSAAFKLFKRCLETLSTENYPIHCLTPVLNKPVSMFVKDNDNKWKEENQGDYMYQSQFIEEYKNDDEKMVTTKLIDGFGDKLYYSYKKMRDVNPKMEVTLYNMATRSSRISDKIGLLNDLVNILPHIPTEQSLSSPGSI